MIEAVIFDMDGLLADTETLHIESWTATLAESGIEITYDYYLEHWIRLGKGIAEFLVERDLKLEGEVLLARKREIFDQLIDEKLKPMPGAHGLLKHLQPQVRMGLASSSWKDTVEQVITSLEMHLFFEEVVTSFDVARLKPHPDPFIEIAKRLNLDPARCVVLEDAEKGVISAHAAGMKSIAIPTEHTQDNDFSKADLIVESLHELDWDRIRSLA